MKKKISLELKITVSFLTLAILAVGVVLSYAIFNTDVSGIESAKILNLASKTFELDYNGLQDDLSSTNMKPGDSKTIEFTIHNTGDLSGTYDIVWTDVTNSFVDRTDLVYSVECTTDGENSCSSHDVTNMIFPFKGTNFPIATDVNIASEEQQSFIIVITFLQTETNQNDNINVSFDAGIAVTNSKSINPNAYHTTVPSAVELLMNYNNYENIGTCSDSTILKKRECEEALEVWNPTNRYYFVGAVDNNFISFANILWRIIEFDIEGKMKLVKAEPIMNPPVEEEEPSFLRIRYGNCGYIPDGNTITCPSYLNSEINYYLEKTYLPNVIADDRGLLINDEYSFGNLSGGEISFESNIGILSKKEYDRTFIDEISYLQPVSLAGNYWLGDVLSSTEVSIAYNIIAGEQTFLEASETGLVVRPTITINVIDFAETGFGTSASPYTIG